MKLEDIQAKLDQLTVGGRVRWQGRIYRVLSVMQDGAEIRTDWIEENDTNPDNIRYRRLRTRKQDVDFEHLV